MNCLKLNHQLHRLKLNHQLNRQAQTPHMKPGLPNCRTESLHRRVYPMDMKLDHLVPGRSSNGRILNIQSQAKP